MSDKKPRGRPSGYDPKYADEMYEMMKEGAKDVHLIAHFEISVDTFYRWLKEHEDFKAAHDKGMPHCQKWWENKGIEYMNAGNSKAFYFWKSFMVKKFGAEWAGAPKEVSTINVNQLNVVNNQMTAQELVDVIKSKYNYLVEKDVLDLNESEYKQIESRGEEPEGITGDGSDSINPS